MNIKDEHIKVEVQERSDWEVNEMVAERKEEALEEAIKEIIESMTSNKTNEEKVEAIDEVTDFYFNLKSINFYEKGL